MSSIEDLNTKIEELKAELQVAMIKKRKEDEEARKAVKPIYRFTLSEITVNRRFHKIFDDSCVLYTLTGEVLNKEEMQRVGNRVFEGSMDYIFNTLSGKFVMPVGGGSIFIENEEAFNELGTIIGSLRNTDLTHVDVSSIVSKYRN